MNSAYGKLLKNELAEIKGNFMACKERIYSSDKLAKEALEKVLILEKEVEEADKDFLKYNGNKVVELYEEYSFKINPNYSVRLVEAAFSYSKYSALINELVNSNPILRQYQEEKVNLTLLKNDLETKKTDYKNALNEKRFWKEKIKQFQVEANKNITLKKKLEYISRDDFTK